LKRTYVESVAVILKARVVSRMLFDNQPRVISGGIVYDCDLQVLVGLAQKSG
jgi:hypothetical protein